MSVREKIKLFFVLFLRIILFARDLPTHIARSNPTTMAADDRELADFGQKNYQDPRHITYRCEEKIPTVLIDVTY